MCWLSAVAASRAPIADSKPSLHAEAYEPCKQACWQCFQQGDWVSLTQVASKQAGAEAHVFPIDKTLIAFRTHILCTLSLACPSAACLASYACRPSQLFWCCSIIPAQHKMLCAGYTCIARPDISAAFRICRLPEHECMGPCSTLAFFISKYAP